MSNRQTLAPPRPIGPLTTPSYWRGVFDAAEPKAGFGFFNEIAPHLPARPGDSFLEIGCGPGGILAEFCGRLGYVAHGIDYATDPVKASRFLESLGISVGCITSGDVFVWSPSCQYDVVASFGFVEHFEDPGAAVDVHFSLVRPGGVVIITLPNLARGQWLLHRLFDKRNLERHNVTCMNLSFLRAAASRNGASISHINYAGGPSGFWPEPVPRGRTETFLMWKCAGLASRFAHTFLPRRNSLLSPYIIGVFTARG